MAKKRRPQEPKESHTPSPPSVHARTRELILKIYRTSVDLDRLLTDYFPDVKQQASPGMTTDERISVLFRLRQLGEILNFLRADAPRHAQQILDIRNGCTQEELDSTVSTPTVPSADPDQSRRKYGIFIPFIIALWEHVRTPIFTAWQNLRVMFQPWRVGILASIAVALVLLAKYLDPTVINPLPAPSIDAAEPERRDAAVANIGTLVSGNLGVGCGGDHPCEDASIPPSDLRDFGKVDPPSKPAEGKTKDKPSLTGIPDADVPVPVQPSDLAETHMPDLARGPISACPESVTIEVQPGSEMIIDEERGRHSIIAAMIETAKSDHIVELRTKCEAQASSASSSPIHFVSKMKINSTVTNNQKMCPPGSSKNCYDLVSRRVTCEFSFAINGFTSGYSCPTGKYFEPVKFEITYHEPSNAQPPWNAARRGDYAIEKCRTLAGAVVQVAVCKRR